MLQVYVYNGNVQGSINKDHICAGMLMAWVHSLVQTVKVHIRRINIFIMILIVLLLSFNTNAHQEQSESMIRAAVVLGVLRFTYWSDENQPNNTIFMCEVGKSSVADALHGLENPPKIGKYSIKIEYLDNIQSANRCHVVLIGRKTSSMELVDNNVLIICDDCEKNYRKLSAISLRRKGSVVRFDINMDLLEQQGISLSATVLELANKCTSSNPAIRACND